MTVLTFDGFDFAADKQCTSGGMKRTVTKIHRVGDLVVGYCGDTDQGMEMLQWVRAGRAVELFPPMQRDPSNADRWACLVVIDGGVVLEYGRTPYPTRFEDPIYASGSGREFAMGAMVCGADARKAVAVAISFDTSCGMGIDVINVLPRPAP